MYTLARDFIRRMTRREPTKRISCEEALKHPWIATKDVVLAPKGLVQSTSLAGETEVAPRILQPGTACPPPQVANANATPAVVSAVQPAQDRKRSRKESLQMVTKPEDLTTWSLESNKVDTPVRTSGVSNVHRSTDNAPSSHRLAKRARIEQVDKA